MIKVLKIEKMQFFVWNSEAYTYKFELKTINIKQKIEVFLANQSETLSILTKT